MMAHLLALLFVIRAWLAAAFLVLQVLDVISTNAALRRADVVEVGDDAIGLPNLAGLAQGAIGRWWWIIKLPLLCFVPLFWISLPGAAETPLILLLLAADAYFLKLVRENFHNARGPRHEQ